MTKNEIEVLEKQLHDVLLLEASETKIHKKENFAYARKLLIYTINELGYRVNITDRFNAKISKEKGGVKGETKQDL